MSIRLVNEAFKANLPTAEKMVLLALCHCHNDETAKCNPMVKVLQEMTGLSNVSIAKYLKDLQERGYLTIHRKQGKRGCYVINNPDLWESKLLGNETVQYSEKGINGQENDGQDELSEVKDVNFRNEADSLLKDDSEVKQVNFRSEVGSFQKLSSLTSEVKDVNFPIYREKEKKRNRKGIEKEIPPKPPKPGGVPQIEIEQVFNHWKSVMDSPRSRLDDKRKAVISKALKLYSVAELMEAIDGCAMSDWHMGMNDRHARYNGLDLILRNAEKIDKFIAITQAPRSKTEVNCGEPWRTEKEIVINGNDTLLLA